MEFTDSRIDDSDVVNVDPIRPLFGRNSGSSSLAVRVLLTSIEEAMVKRALCRFRSSVCVDACPYRSLHFELRKVKNEQGIWISWRLQDTL